jgi:hypothetical protein
MVAVYFDIVKIFSIINFVMPDRYNYIKINIR